MGAMHEFDYLVGHYDIVATSAGMTTQLGPGPSGHQFMVLSEILERQIQVAPLGVSRGNT